MPLSALQSRNNSATDALRHAVMALQQAHIETASLDARLLLQHVMGISREELLGESRLKLTLAQDASYHELIEKRKSRCPVSQLIGKREFWGREFKVTAATLDPRPDSETLIEAVLEKIQDRTQALRILDLGTGTGCLLLTLLAEYSNARGVGVDSCEKALQVASGNAVQLGVQERAEFVQSCWGKKVSGTFDIVISNPPYIPTKAIASLAPEVCCHEPMAALDGGEDGLDAYRAILAQLPPLLSEDALVVFEIGMGQEKELAKMAEAAGFQVAGFRQDLSGIIRCLLLNQPPRSHAG